MSLLNGFHPKSKFLIFEIKNLAVAMLEKLIEMKALLEKLISDGRSTPVTLQKNDVEMRRYPENANDSPKKKKAKAAK